MRVLSFEKYIALGALAGAKYRQVLGKKQEMEPQVYHQPQISTGGPFQTQTAFVFGKGRVHATERMDKLEPAADKSEHQRTSFAVASRDLHSPLQIVADSLVIVALSLLTGIGYELVVNGNIGPVADFTYTGVIVSLLFASIRRLISDPHLLTLTTSFERIRKAAQAWSLAFAALVLILFVLKASSGFSRGAIFSFYLIGLPVMATWRVFSPVMLAPLVRKAGVASRACILIGDSADPFLAKFAAELIESGYPAPTVLTFCGSCGPTAWLQEQDDLIKRVASTAHDLKQGEVYLCAGSVSSDRLMAIGRALSILPRAIYIVPDAQTASLVRCKPALVGTQIAVEIRREPLGRIQGAIKRFMDIIVAGVVLVLIGPVFAIVAFAIKVDSPGPVFFRQTRNGYRGKSFRIFKFRSMYVQEDGPVIHQASRDDARVTCVGKFLRNSSIDELPQLINVLMGQMSLVGPRPHAQAHDVLYARSIENYEVRQHVKPGLTGWAQVHGLRGQTATLDLMYRRIEFDLWYAVNASLLLDCEILLRTIVEVFRRRNAY